MPQNGTVAQKHGTVVQNTHCSVFVPLFYGKPMEKWNSGTKHGTVLQNTEQWYKTHCSILVPLFLMKKGNSDKKTEQQYENTEQ